jgi:SPOR domain
MTKTTEVDRELSLQDEDRLPWLEAVEDDEDEGLSSGRMMGFLMLALLALGLIVGGVWWLRSQSQGPTGDGTLIAAQEGDYKVKPDAPGGMKVEGQGDSAFAASEGAEANGKLDPNAKSETPVVGTKAATNPVLVAPPSRPVVSATVPSAGAPLATPAPMTGNTLVQLGAYGSVATATAAWDRLASAHPVLSRLTKTIVPAAVGGNTLYRLRANAGTSANAAAVCSQVGNCMVVK